MRNILILGLVLPAISFALPIKKNERFRVQIPNEYIVHSTTKNISDKIIKKLGKDLFLVRAQNKKSLSKYSKVSPNFAYYGNYLDIEEDNTPNDVNFSKQFHHEMIFTTKAWSITKGSKDIIVAVTDNEFQIDHQDLTGIWWKNESEIPGNGIDDDNNGYIDDVIGWDFMGDDNDVDTYGDTTHGTHVSGIIAANSNNTLEGSGIAPGVKVMPLRWYGSERAWTSAIIAETYHYAVDNGAKIISTSYNIDALVDDEVYIDSIKYARDHDVLIFNSAGNGGQKDPARGVLDDLILVCSVKSSSAKDQDKKSSFSNYGAGIDICAPGDPIYAPVQSNNADQIRYGELSGTSMATPVAAAVAALIWSAHPNYSDEEVREKLYSTADNIDSRNFWYRGKLGHGRVNAFNAVQ